MEGLGHGEVDRVPSVYLCQRCGAIAEQQIGEYVGARRRAKDLPNHVLGHVRAKCCGFSVCTAYCHPIVENVLRAAGYLKIFIVCQ